MLNFLIVVSVFIVVEQQLGIGRYLRRCEIWCTLVSRPNLRSANGSDDLATKHDNNKHRLDSK